MAIAADLEWQCGLKITSFTSTSELLNPNSGSSVGITGSISDSSDQTINWTATVADRIFSGTGKTPSFSWNGKDNNGKTVTDGTYQITLNATTADGKCSDSKSLSIVVKSSCDLNIVVNKSPIAPYSGGDINISGNITDSSGNPINWTITLPNGLQPVTGGGNQPAASWDGKTDGKIQTGTYNATITASSSDTCSKSESVPISITPDPNNNACGFQVQVGSSANVANGNLTHSQDLFSSMGGALPIGLTLYYNSLDPHNGSLGRSWSHNYDVSLKENSDGSVLFSKGNWKYDYFTLYNGAYTAQSGNYSTLVKNGDVSFTLTSKDGQVSIFAADGTLTSITDRNGNTINFTYSGSNLSTVTDPSGRTAAFSYDGSNHLTSVTDPSGNTYVFSVGTTLSSVTQPDGGVWQYAYDDKAFMLTKTDPLGNITTYTYDDKHRVVSSSDPEGQTRSITYPQTTDTVKSTTFTEKDGGTWSYTYDTGKGQLLSKTDPQSGTTSYTYDANGNRISTTAPDGTATSSVYDNLGNMTSTTDALGKTTSYTYNTFGQTATVTDPQGGITSYGYDAKGNMTSLTDQAGAVTKYSYDTKGNVATITDPLGLATGFTYDQSGNLATVSDSAGATTSYSYDAAGNLITVTDPKGAVTTFVYDNLNRIIKTIDPQGNATVNGYDKNGNKTSDIDANGNTTKYEYNSQNQLIKTIDALGNATTYGYGGAGCSSCGGGGNGKLTSLTDANNNTTGYEYDQLGRLARETDPLGNVTGYVYDAKNNPTSKTDANGNTITYGYDATGRMLKKSYPDGSEESFSYDDKGNILTAANKNISYTFSYDSAGRMLTSTDSTGRAVQYGYDIAGRKTNLTYPDGASAAYSYDTAGRHSKITSSGKDYSFTYDTLGKRTKLGYPSGASANYGYDTTGKLISLTHKGALGFTIGSFAYTHDKVGNRLSKKQPIQTTSYTYDAIYRLTLAKSSLPWENEEQYSYDLVGNRLSGPKGATSYLYNQANQLTEEMGHSVGLLAGLFGKTAAPTGKAEFKYDKNGNLIKKAEPTALPNTLVTTLYSYDFENRLTQAEIHFGQATVTTTFIYDPFGRRIGKKTIGTSCLISGIDTHTYVYDGQNIIQEYRDTNVLGADYTGTTRYLHGPGTDEPLSLTRGGNIWYYHADGLGSIVALSNKYGIVVDKIDYDSFGNRKPGIHLIGQPYSYTGREWDKETGLYYYRARYYDPMEGRFIQKDPIGIDGGINLYNYVLSNPINLTDPSGERVSVFTRSLDMKVKSGPYVHCVLVVEKCDGTKQTWDFQNDNIVYSPAKNPSNPIKNPLTTVVYAKDDLDDKISFIANEMGHPGYDTTNYNCCYWVEDALRKAGISWKNPNPWPAN